MAIVLSGTTGIDAGSLPVSNCGNTEVEGNLNLSGVGTRITGDFSNSTIGNRVAFQTNVPNTYTTVAAIPNGTGANASFQCYSSSDMNNSTRVHISAGTSFVEINSSYVGAASYVPLIFTTGGSERMRIDTAGNIGIGTAPMRKFHIHDASLPIIQLTNSTTGNTDANRGGLIYQNSTSMYITNKENGFIYLGNNALSQVQISPTGDLQLTSGTGGIGYGTGAGGTVTQLTSKSTDVTLNKPSGTIITNGSALAAGTTVGFTFFNSVYTNTYDIINFQLLNNANAASYNIWATNNGPGFGFRIHIKNISASSLSDVLQINFSLVKGAIA